MVSFMRLRRRRATWCATLGVIATMVLPRPSGAQEITEFDGIPPGQGPQPSAIVRGPDGAMWFGVSFAPGGNRIARISADGTIRDFTLPFFGSGPTGITVGPDRALWFVLQSANRIGRLTTNGELTTFLIPTPDSAPVSITAGPDGALWFTESGCSVEDLPELFCDEGKIGRITTDGDITEFGVPFGRGAPWGITVGPDDALWFTEPNGERIGRITTNGSIREFRLPRPGPGQSPSFPSGIVAGPDGALWFGQVNQIGRITTNGTFTAFPLPRANSDAGSIAVGPDGALWFTRHQANRVGRMTTDGDVTEFPVPPPTGGFPTTGVGGNFGASGIASDGRSAMWFIEQFANKIARITVPPGPQLSVKLSPRTGCASSAVKARIRVTGGAKLARVDISLDGRRVRRVTQRDFRVRVSVRGLRAGTHTLRVRAVDTEDRRDTVTLTFRRCTGARFTG